MKTTYFFLLFLLNVQLFSNEITKSYDLNYVREFVYIGAGKIEIKQSNRNRLTLTGKEVLLNKTLFSNEEGVLTLAPKDAFFTGQSPEIIRGTLEVKDLKRITLDGSVSVDIDELKGDELSVELLAQGSSLFEAHLELQKLSLRIEGSAEAILKGSADTQLIAITEAGTFMGEEFKTKTATIHIHGAGTAFVNASEILNALVYGFGHIHYIGTPKINDRIIGEGKVFPYIDGMKR